MPTYDYECESCGFEFEAWHSMSAEPLVVCPECHEHKLMKLISPGASIHIPGTENPCNGGKTCKKIDKLGEGINKSEKPFWRDGKINKKILKDPEGYIRKGMVD